MRIGFVLTHAGWSGSARFDGDAVQRPHGHTATRRASCPHEEVLRTVGKGRWSRKRATLSRIYVTIHV